MPSGRLEVQPFWRVVIAQEKEQRINEDIVGSEFRLIGAAGEQVGIVSAAKAKAMAEEAGLDLVEIAPTAKPPVLRIMDYGKFKYQEAKRAHEAKQKQKQIQVKEIKFRPGTDENDYQIKLRNLIKFLHEGDKAKITLRFRGREMTHQDLGMRMLERIKTDLAEHGQVEQFPKMEGRQLIMVLAPIKKSAKPLAAPQATAEGKRSPKAASAAAAISAAEAGATEFAAPTDIAA